ncbi:MAG: hypothetical protein GDA38_07035 [Hormoscilla sp. SP12CHS1]|nr:hypothetical protein [Hormoscilla sp. SP12CHS1]
MRSASNWAEMPDAGTLLARDLQTQQRLIPPKRILPMDGPERERELFPNRGWVHLTPPPIATAPRRQETRFLRAILLFEH